MLQKIIWTHFPPAGSSVSQMFGTLFNTVSILASPSVNFGVAPGLFSCRLFIPTCRNWLTAQHTTGSRSTGSRSMLPWTLHHPNKWINIFFYPLFLEGKTLKYVFWDKESLGLFQLCFLCFFVCPASLLLPLWPSTQTIHGGALIYGTLGRTGMS